MYVCVYAKYSCETTSTDGFCDRYTHLHTHTHTFKMTWTSSKEKPSYDKTHTCSQYTHKQTYIHAHTFRMTWTSSKPKPSYDKTHTCSHQPKMKIRSIPRPVREMLEAHPENPTNKWTRMGGMKSLRKPYVSMCICVYMRVRVKVCVYMCVYMSSVCVYILYMST